MSHAVAEALGIRERTGRPVVEALVDALRERDVLLVLDNCEHLPTACADLAECLLRACPEVRFWRPAANHWAPRARFDGLCHR
jgi:predicted ATPase